MGFDAALIFRSGKNLLKSVNAIPNGRFLSNKSAVITKIHRNQYLKLYKTLMVQPDGSTFTFRHHEPRRIVKTILITTPLRMPAADIAGETAGKGPPKLPINLATLSEEERAYYLEKRKPKQKVVIKQEMDIAFDSKKYLNLIKKT